MQYLSVAHPTEAVEKYAKSIIIVVHRVSVSLQIKEKFIKLTQNASNRIAKL